MSLVYEGTVRVLPLLPPTPSAPSLIGALSVAKLDEALPLNRLCGGLIVGVFSFFAFICLSPFLPLTIILKF